MEHKNGLYKDGFRITMSIPKARNALILAGLFCILTFVMVGVIKNSSIKNIASIAGAFIIYFNAVRFSKYFGAVLVNIDAENSKKK